MKFHLTKISIVFLGSSALCLLVICLSVAFWITSEPTSSIDRDSTGRLSGAATTRFTTAAVHGETDHPESLITERTQYNSSRPIDPEDFWEICGPQEEFSEDIDERVEYRLQLKEAGYSEECQAAFDAYMFAHTPYTLRAGIGNRHKQFFFFEVDNPLTFERIFGDPAGNLERIIAALTWPECRLEDTVTAEGFIDREHGWGLKEACHADAFMSYAWFFDECFRGRWTTRRHWGPTPGTPAFSYRGDWEIREEIAWIAAQCARFTESESPPLLDVDSYSEIYTWLVSRRTGEPVLEKGELVYSLTAMAARLGDELAGLHRDGRIFGPYGSPLVQRSWQELEQRKAPSRERMEYALDFVRLVEEKELKYNFNWLVEHLCWPHKFYGYKPATSCRSVLEEMYLDDSLTDSELEILDRFQRVAKELGVYEMELGDYVEEWDSYE